MRILLLLLLLILPALLRAAERDGAAIYREMCASCHGEQGEGSKDYPEPLVGDRSLGQLGHYIDQQMPEGDPDSLNAEDSATVAKYIHEAFYSPVAQARNKPARIDLSRLTVKQYQNAVTALVASFRQPGGGQSGAAMDEHGLRAEYFKGRRPDNKNRVFERVDATVDFTYDNKTPDKKIDGPEFAVRWEGSVFAPDSGEYEFVVRTEHATRLWVNQAFFNGGPPLIDKGVKSGTDTEYRATIYLLGGRLYPIRLEYIKGKGGVGDPKLNKDVDKLGKSSIHLLWVIPRRTLEVIPARYLTTARNSELFVATTPFPPDDRSIGYERANTISKAWDNSTTDGALEVAGYVVERFKSLSGDVPLDTKEESQVKDWCYKFVARAFRRPLSEKQKSYFVDRHFTAAPDRTNAVKRVVLLALKSPRFLYREVGTVKPDQYDVASRLAFGLWDSLPDAKLLQAAADKKLGTREQVVAAAARMQNDPRARDKLRGFLLQWLRLDQPIDMAKDEKLFPDFKPEVISDLRTSLELSLQDFLTSKSADFRNFLLDEELYLNGRLSQLYGADLPADAPFQKVQLDADQRAGILTHPYLLSVFAYNGTSSPIHRGVFLARSMLGRVIKPPQEAFQPIAPDLHPSLSTRERVTLQTKSEACQLCHNMINPLGFSLENFDAIGKFRVQEKARPIDTQGSYISRDDKNVKFQGARELGKFLAESPEVTSALTQQLFQFEIKQPIRAYGSDRLEKLRTDFVENGYNFQRLAREIVVTAALPEPLTGE